MDDTKLDNKFKAYYGEQSLPMESVQRILEEGAAVKKTSSVVNSNWWKGWVPVAIAACMALLATFQFARSTHAEPSYAEEVAGSIAMRHNNMHDFDVAASNYSEVQTGLKDLVFSVQPVVKQKLLSAYELLGARYCQIEGLQAAHIQVRDRKSGTLCSLYIASLEGPLKHLQDSDENLDLAANHVDLWADSGRLFALVH